MPPRDTARTRRLVAMLALYWLLLGSVPASAASWVGTWTASPQPTWSQDFAFPTKIPETVRDQTFRQVVKISLGGSRFRFLFSNAYGDKPLTIGAASVAVACQRCRAFTGSIRKITFGGRDSIVIPPGAPAISDPVALRVSSQAHLFISTYLPRETELKTFHWDGRQTASFGPGDLTRSIEFPRGAKTDARILLSEVLVDAPNSGSVVVLGDSITDGNGATVDADTRWPDFLAKRLLPYQVTVLNAGISGARLLQEKMGASAAARLDRDVFAQPNVKAVILLIGINDIAWPGTAFAPHQTRPSVEAMIAGYKQFVALAHAHNIRVFGGTLTPFEGALPGTPLANYYDAEKDALRQRVNRWLRTGTVFDGLVDFDRILRDRAHPARLAPAFDSGDHLHPGDKGNEAMANAIDLKALLGGY